MKKYLLLLLCIPLLVTGCKRVPKLADGKEVVASLGDKQFTVEELYSYMREKNGANYLIDMIDNYIVSQELTEDMQKEAKTSTEAAYNYYAAYYGTQFEAALKSSGFNSADDFKTYLLKENQKNLTIEKYVKENVVTDKEIQKYYDESINGELSVRHILIIPEVKDGMTEAEKNEAKKKALEEAKALIAQLKASSDLDADFAALAKEKSDDTGTASQGGLIENITNESGLVEEFYKASLNLQVGAMTNDPVETIYGYHIIYKTAQKEKPALEDVKAKIIEIVCNKLLSSDTNAAKVYWVGLREKYNIDIYDDDMKNDYKAVIK